MPDILILYSTVDGHTRTICERIAQIIDETGSQSVLLRIEDAAAINPADYDKIVIGASIRYGKHRPSVFDFIHTHLDVLTSRPSAFFTVNIVARKPAKNRPETNPYLQKFLGRTPWKPHLLEVFAGKLDYPSYRWLDRLAICFILWLTKGPTDMNSVVEFTDWARVEAFARQITTMY